MLVLYEPTFSSDLAIYSQGPEILYTFLTTGNEMPCAPGKTSRRGEGVFNPGWPGIHRTNSTCRFRFETPLFFLSPLLNSNRSEDSEFPNPRALVWINIRDRGCSQQSKNILRRAGANWSKKAGSHHLDHYKSYQHKAPDFDRPLNGDIQRHFHRAWGVTREAPLDTHQDGWGLVPLPNFESGYVRDWPFEIMDFLVSMTAMSLAAGVT